MKKVMVVVSLFIVMLMSAGCTGSDDEGGTTTPTTLSTADRLIKCRELDAVWREAMSKTYSNGSKVLQATLEDITSAKTALGCH